MATKQTDYRGLREGQIGSLLVLMDPDDPEVGLGAAGDRAAKPFVPWPFECICVQITGTAGSPAPTSDVVRLLVSNDGTNWTTIAETTFTTKTPQTITLENLKYRFADVEIDGAATGQYLVTAFMAQE